jgi:hypothetical protein
VPGQSILNNREAVAEAVARSQSIAGALKLLDLRPAGGNYRALRLACERFGLELPVYQGGPRQGAPAVRPSKIDWPDHQQLRMLVAATSYSEAARQLGVSATAVRKRLQRPEDQSRLPVSNPRPPVYRTGALPAELRRREPAPGRDWSVPMLCCLLAAAVTAGLAMVLAARSGSAAGLAIAAGCCALVLLAALA